MDSSVHYTLPKSTMHYKTVTDYINNFGFLGSYPVSFIGQSDYFTETGCAPLYSVHPEDDHKTGVLTINMMIEMTFLGISWHLSNLDDLDKIIKAIVDYKEYADRYVEPNEDLKIYMKKIEVFIPHLNRLQQQRENRSMKATTRIVNLFSALSNVIQGR